MSESKMDSHDREQAEVPEATPAVSTATEPTPAAAPKPAASAPDTALKRSTQPVLHALTKEIRDGDLARPIGLTDYMFQLGMHFDLPERIELTVAAPEIQKQKGTRIWLVMLAVIVVLAGSVVPFLARPERITTLPADVLGEWHSSSPRYAGRMFALSSDRVRLDFGEHAAAVAFPISEVRRRQLGDTIVFQVLYRQESGLTQFQFTFVESNSPPTIQLPNPLGIDWVRASDVAAIEQESRRRPIRGVVPGESRKR